MSSTQHQIRAASQRNQELLKGLADTDYAPSALEQNNKHIEDLSAQLKLSEKLVQKLQLATQRERKEHLKYEESTVRRFALRMTGQKEKFQEKSSKEEREYFNAIQQQKSAEDKHSLLLHNRDEAMKARSNLEAPAQRHTQLQQDLDVLYNHIFQGATPEFPEEDQQEQAAAVAQSRHSHLASQWDTEKTAIGILRDAQTLMRSVLRDMADAHSTSQWEMVGGGTFAGMTERANLSRAEKGVSQVQMLLNQAQRLHQQIGDVGPMNVAHGSLLGNVVFKNYFSNYAVHQKIKESEAQLHQASRNLEQEMEAARQREVSLKWELDQATAQRHQARQDLQSVRSHAFEMVGNDSQQWASKR